MATDRDPKVPLSRADLDSSLGFGRRGSGVQPKVDASERPPAEDLDLTPEQQARIDGMFAALATMSLYELLGVPSDADKRDIKRAYHERAREFHPDRFFRKRLGGYKRKLEAIVSRMADAHDLLCSPERRAEYDVVRRTNRHSLIEQLLHQVAAEMEGAEEGARRERIDVDPAIQMDATSEVRARPAGGESFGDPVARLRALHAKREAHALSDEERATYDALADDFAREFVVTRSLPVEPGQTYRRALRAALAIKLQVDASDRSERTISLAVSGGGFAALLGAPLAVGSACGFVLQVAPEPLRGRARVVSCEPYGSRGALSRVSFAIERLAASDLDRLDRLVLGAALTASRTPR